jgi:hypothetical protein
MPVLKDPQKTEIVRLLAAFHTPTGVAVKLQEDIGICVDRAQVIRYDPTKPCYEGGDRWRAIFWEARKRYLQEIASIPIAHSGFRLNQIQIIFEEAERRGNYRLALRALEQAAREAQAVQGAGGNLASQPPHMEADEARRALKEYLKRSVEQAREEGREQARKELLPGGDEREAEIAETATAMLGEGGSNVPQTNP